MKFHSNIWKGRIVRYVLFLSLPHWTFVIGQDCTKIYSYDHHSAYLPSTYTAKYATEAPHIDGELSDAAWDLLPYSADFIDIEGHHMLAPEHRTQVKILWDSAFLYIGALLEEDHIWATLTQKDDIIYRDNDFEIFIDANGDGHHYQEIEINALGTVMDLWMIAPYGRGSGKKYIMEWEARGLQSAVHLQGTINEPDDTDRAWSVEIAIPIRLLGQISDFWRINFSRVDWLTDVVDGNYTKRKLQERNWVWSPTGYVNMHMPETWGYLFFEDGSSIPESETMKWELWKAYFSVLDFHKDNGYYPQDFSCFKVNDAVRMESSSTGFDLFIDHHDEVWTINELALISKQKSK